MYHIANDERAKKSAGSLYNGLIAELHKKDFINITISDITKSSRVSRSTFYRLFDNITDIILWKCEIIMVSTINEMIESNSSSFKDAFYVFYDKWKNNLDLLREMEKNNQLSLLIMLHEKYIEDIKSLFFKTSNLSLLEQEFIIEVMVGLIPVVLRILIKHPTMSKDECYKELRNNFKLMQNLINEKNIKM